jgi:hypothetical protein
MNAKSLALGLTVILAGNAVLLIGVARNRSAGPIQTVELSERELPMMPRGEEDSSVSLRLEYRPRFFRWRDDAHADGSREGTFDGEKLQALGFRCGTADAASPYFRVPRRRMVFVALEYRENLSDEPAGKPVPIPSNIGQQSATAAGRTQSGLVVVDAARSYEQLRLKYPDPRKHLIVRGLVAASTVDNPGSAKDPYWLGRVAGILPPEIQVPLPYSMELNRLGAEERKLSRYAVTLHYGRNMEPWIGSVTVSRK